PARDRLPLAARRGPLRCGVPGRRPEAVHPVQGRGHGDRVRDARRNPARRDGRAERPTRAHAAARTVRDRHLGLRTRIRSGRGPERSEGPSHSTRTRETSIPTFLTEQQLHPDYPLPDLDDPIMRPFWDGARDGKLMQQRDRTTGDVHWPPRPIYWKGGKRLEWFEASGKGTVYTY